MNNHVTFDQLPLRFRFLIRGLAFCCLGLGTYVLSTHGWHNIPHMLLCAGLFAFSLYFLAGSLTLLSCIVAKYGGRASGYAFAFGRRMFRKYAARSV